MYARPFGMGPLVARWYDRRRPETIPSLPAMFTYRVFSNSFECLNVLLNGVVGYRIRLIVGPQLDPR